MGQALYRKYRSKSLGDIVGQEHITKTLDTALKSGRLSHAYLFTGPRGTGKTSIARILAHEINQLPYTDDSMHLDIIEIDAASNRRIDEIRDLRDKVHMAPTSAQYKVYIIDEVHMLTKEAFNALLKTLEEPPAHVIFILATTEFHKLPETIISRTQRFTFKPVETDKVVDHLRSIAKTEKIVIDDAALTFLARAGEGSFRDSISLLDQIGASGQKVGLAEVQQLLGIPSEEAVQKLIEAVHAGASPSDVLIILDNLIDSGFQPVQVARQLSRTLRQAITSQSGELPVAQALSLMRKLIDTERSHDPQRYLEITLIEEAAGFTAAVPVQLQAVAAAPSVPSAPYEGASPKQPSQPTIQQSPPRAAAPKHVPSPSTPPQSQPSPVVIETPNESFSALEGEAIVPDSIDFWPDVIDAVRKKYYTLYSVLKTAEPTLTAEGLQLACTYPFHQKRVKEAKNTHIISSVMHEVTGKNIAWSCVVKTVAQTNANGQELASISNIFGGGELLES